MIKMSEKYLFQIDEEEGERIDVFLSLNMKEKSRSAVQKLMSGGMVTVNGKVVKPSYKLSLDDTVELFLPEPIEMDIEAENIPLDIVYEDGDLIIINKPQGMVVHPAPGHYTGTVVNALMYHCKNGLSGINGELRPGIVHRIDKDTSGIIVAAKNDRSHQKLSEQFAQHSITRKYEAVTFNNIKEQSITIDAPIGRNPLDRKKMCVTEKNAKRAVTYINVLESFNKFTYVEAKLETGRTHQIRVHLSYKGYPILGDLVYGYKKQPFKLNGQALHAGLLGFIHPNTGEYMEFSSPLPDYFKAILNKLPKV